MIEFFFVPETKPRDTKHTLVIIAIRYFNKDHILMTRSEAEDTLPIKSHILILQNTLKVSNIQIMPGMIILGFIYALPAYRGLMRAEGLKYIPIF